MSNELERVSGIGPISSINLSKAGVKTIEDIASSKAKNIIENANDLLKLEKNIQFVLNSIKENFVKTCPKCSGAMKSKYIILGPERRLKVRQCTICKFYLPE